MKNLQNMMKQAQELQSKMADMQAQLAQTEMSGEAGAGMVTVTLNGKGEMRGIKIDKSLVDPDDVETLEDLIVAATNTAKKRIEEYVSGEMSKMAGGLPLPPGMKLPF